MTRMMLLMLRRIAIIEMIVASFESYYILYQQYIESCFSSTSNFTHNSNRNIGIHVEIQNVKKSLHPEHN